MMNSMIGLAACLLVVAVPATGASAAVVYDGFPTGTLHEANWVNNSSDQNFLVQASFGAATTVTGFEILAGSGFWGLGDATRIKIRADVGGAPDTVNLYSFVDAVDALSLYETGVNQVTSNFSGISLAAGTYWFGLSSEPRSGVWASYNNGGPVQPLTQWQLNQDSLSFQPFLYDLSFRVLGNAVPEPATWAMMIGGFGLVGAAMRRRAAATVTA